MTLTPLSLDTLEWEDLRRLGQQLVPLASGGRWTHHAASDPGITLLELLTYLIDQQIFVMDQLSPDMQLAIMALLGDTPRGAAAARTVVSAPPGTLTTARSLALGDPLVPLGGASAGQTFSFVEDALFLPVSSQAVLVDGVDRTLDLEQGRPVALFGYGDEGLLPLELCLTLAVPVEPELVGQTLAVALLLDSDRVVLPEWDPQAVTVEPPMQLMLQLGAAAGPLAPAPGGWRDGTGGLRRSGLMRFAVPPEWQGQTSLRIALAGERLGHAEPPRLKSIGAGSAIIRHARPIRIDSADNGDPVHDALRGDLVQAVADWLPLSGTELVLPGELYPVIESSLKLALRDRSGAWHDWQRTDSLVARDAGSRSFTFDRTQSRLRFGDGFNGRVPAPADNLVFEAEIGGGKAGNHPEGLQWRLADGTGLISRAPATGGAEPETLAQAQARISQALTEVTRAVTVDDHRVLVETAPGVAGHRASVAPGFDPRFPCLRSPDCITVFVVPVTAEQSLAPMADRGALQHFRAIFEQARLLTTRVIVERVTIRPVDLQVELEGLAMRAAIEDRLQGLLTRYLHCALGGAEGAGWPFGHPLRPSELMRVIDPALPAGGRVAHVGIRLLDDPGSVANSCSDTPIGPHELVWLASLTVSATAAHPAGAVL